MRVAIFFTPACEHSLTQAAAAWLMRDAFTDESAPAPPDPSLSEGEIGELTAEPRRYGFHATLKAPFRLAANVRLGDLVEAVDAFAGQTPVHTIEALRLEQLGPFFALTPHRPDTALDALAADVVTTFDRFRAPLSAAEIARRRPDSLTPSQARNLERWGYPFVLDDFQFHMTLTGAVAAGRQATVAAALARRFAAFLGQAIKVDALSVFVEPRPGAGFTVATRCPCRAGTWPNL